MDFQTINHLVLLIHFSRSKFYEKIVIRKHSGGSISSKANDANFIVSYLNSQIPYEQEKKELIQIINQMF